MSGITGGELLAQMLQKEGVEKVFGIIDGTYHSLYTILDNHGIDLITPRHETTAIHMAGAYARISGKLGVCLASNGPGVANALPGVVVENAEGNRVLLITSCRRTGITYPDRGGTYQYFNQVATIKPISKWSGTVSAADRIPELMRRALRISHIGRPGVVHLDVPENIINSKSSFPDSWEINQYRNVELISPSETSIERAIKMILTAKLPVIHAGSGVIHSNAYKELEALAERFQIPVCTSWAARGILSESSPLAWPMVHVKACNELRKQADLIICLGSNLGETDWWGKPPNWGGYAEQKMIQVDIDEQIIGMNKPTDLAILSDVKVFLQHLLHHPAIKKHHPDLSARKARLAKLEKTKEKDRLKLDAKLEDVGSPMITAHVGRVCRELFADEDIVVFDGGNTAVWGNFYHEIRQPNTQLSTAHFGMLGAGTAQALGAAVAKPDRFVYCITGDGAFGFHPQEIETAVRNKLKVIYLVCCDKQWGMVKIGQHFANKPIKTLIKKSLSPEESINTDLGEIRFDQLAEAMGAHGEQVSAPGELKDAIKRCKEANKPGVIHINVDPVKHMWAPGLVHFKKMHQEPK